MSIIDSWHVWRRKVDEKTLPSVTTSDNGKVLTVVNGKWSVAEPAFCGTKVQFVSDGSVYSTSYIPSGDSVTAPHTNPTKSGKVFKGWVASEGSTTVLTFPYTVNADTTLYAYFSDPVQVGYEINYTGSIDTSALSGAANVAAFLTSVGATGISTAMGLCTGNENKNNVIRSFSNLSVYNNSGWVYDVNTDGDIVVVLITSFIFSNAASLTGYSEAQTAFGSSSVTPIYG